MKRVDAIQICNNLLAGPGQLARHFKTWMLCGSIRRYRDEVGDIDLVAILIPESKYSFGEQTLSDRIKQLDSEGYKQAKELGPQAASRFLDGPLIKRFQFEGMMIDLYIATEKTFEGLKLIRTGSKDHNVRLTTLAKYKGLKLKANGIGLVDRNDESIIYENTEDGILTKLLGFVPEPKKRGID